MTDGMNRPTITARGRAARFTRTGQRSLAPMRRRARALRRRYATDPRHRPPKGLPAFWTRARRLFWSWWPWSLVSVWAFSSDHTGWGIGTLAMALFSYMAAPVETQPRFGLDHEMAVESEDFLTSIAGATGSPFIPGNRIDVLNNGDEFFPVM